MVYHDISQEQLLLLITQAVQAELQKRSRQVPVGISVRHIHLTRDDVDRLFGYGYQLTPKKALSQPGQFACEECLDIIGPKGELKHVRILGPERSATQIELAQTDCRSIGIQAPVRSSGDTKGTPGVTLRGPRGTLTVPEGVMIADRHIHMTPAQAAAFGLADGDRVQVKIDGLKPGVMGGVLIRANDKCALDFHIDTDDGNAFLLKQGQLVTVLGFGRRQTCRRPAWSADHRLRKRRLLLLRHRRPAPLSVRGSGQPEQGHSGQGDRAERTGHHRTSAP